MKAAVTFRLRLGLVVSLERLEDLTPLNVRDQIETVAPLEEVGTNLDTLRSGSFSLHGD